MVLNDPDTEVPGHETIYAIFTERRSLSNLPDIANSANFESLFIEIISLRRFNIKLMVYIVGASFLKHAIENLPPRKKRVVAKFVTAVSSLSLNPNTSPKRPLINLSHLLERGYLRQNNKFSDLTRRYQ